MLQTQIRQAIDAQSAKVLATPALRRHFHVADLFAAGEIRLVYKHCDRLILDAAVHGPEGPDSPTLDEVPETGTPSFLDRRDPGVLDIGEAGTVSVGGRDHDPANGDVLCVGMGAGQVAFSGPGRFYILSVPADRSCPTRLIGPADARRVEMGSRETANERVVIQFPHPDVWETCQLAVGYAQVQPRFLWNAMPVHLHECRACLSFGLPEDARVFHFIGQPEEIRHIVMPNEGAVISPPWPIPCGAGRAPHTFCRAVAGDNVDFTDMEMVAMESPR